MDSYKEELTKVMRWLGEKPDTIFIGQNIIYGGNAIFDTLRDVPIEKKIEVPVIEDAQLGMSIGMLLCNKTVISIYPRFDFLLLAVNQLVNHLDKLENFTHNQYHAKVIIRVGIGSTKPMYPGVQHCGDYTEAFRKMTKRLNILKIDKSEQAFHAYRCAYNAEYPVSSLIVEDMGLYASPL